MLICQQCKQTSNCVAVEACQYCGARNWLGDSSEPFSLALKLKFVRMKVEAFVFGAGYLVVAFGMLWMFVFVVKWMWRHS